MISHRSVHTLSVSAVAIKEIHRHDDQKGELQSNDREFPTDGREKKENVYSRCGFLAPSADIRINTLRLRFDL